MKRFLHSLVFIILTISLQVGHSQISTFPHQEGFENAGAIPTGWTQEYVTDASDWAFTGDNQNSSVSARTGSYLALFQVSDYSGDQTRLVTPAFDLTGLAVPTLKFYYTQVEWSGDQDELRIYYKTSAGGSWTLLATYTSDITTWTEETLALPSPSNDYYIAFEGTSGYGRGVTVDDIEVLDQNCTPAITNNVTLVPNCPTDNSVSFQVSNLGSASSLTVTNDAGGTNPAPITGSGTGYTVSNLPTDGSSVTITLTPDDDVACAVTIGPITLTPCLPDNDDCDDATVLQCGDMLTENSTAATGSISATCTGTSGAPVWYTFTPTEDGDITITVDPTGWDPQIDVFDTTCGNESDANCVAGVDDGGTGDLETVTFSATASTTYIIAVGNYISSGSGGEFTLEVECCGANDVYLEMTNDTYTLDEPCDDANGWTYYSAPGVLGNYMFAILWGVNNGAAKAAATVEVSVTNMISEEDGTTAASYGMGRYWNVDLGAASLIDDVSIRFYYAPAEKTAVETAAADFASLNGVPNNGFSWFKTDATVFTPADITANDFQASMILLTADDSGTENGVTYVQFDNISSFSGGTGAAGAGVGFLPAELLSFDGEAIKDGNKLLWSTATEENVADFIIERATDIRTGWETLGKVQAAGNSADMQRYSFMDDKPLTQAYYRLRIEDADGSFDYSPIIELRREREKGDLSIYPVPADEQIMARFTSETTGEIQLHIYDLSGRMIATQLTSGEAGSQQLPVDIRTLEKGVYILEVEQGGDIFRQRFVKQ